MGMVVTPAILIPSTHTGDSQMFNINRIEDHSTTELEFIRDRFILTDHDRDLIQFELNSRKYQEQVAVADIAATLI